MNAVRPASAWLALLFAAASATPGAGQEAPQLSDAEIAHVAVTANAIDIDLAELAPSRASDDEVAAFARTMVVDHTAVNERAAALAGRLGVVPRDNAVSQSLLAGAEEARDDLEPASGSAFDRAYMEREVAYHQAVSTRWTGSSSPRRRTPSCARSSRRCGRPSTPTCTTRVRSSTG